MKTHAKTLAIVLAIGGAFYFLASSPPAESRAAQTATKPEKTGNAEKTKTAPAKTAKTKQASAKKKEKTKGSANPLRRLIRNLIPKPSEKPILPKRRMKVELPEVDDPNSRAKFLRARDHIDARAPHDPEDITRLRRAESLVNELVEKEKNGQPVTVEQWSAALAMVQRLLDRKDDSLVRNASGDWVSVRGQANKLLGRLPKPMRDKYRLRFGAAARAKLDEAMQSGDLRSVAEVATRYFHTKAGADAARHLCAIFLDRGEFGIAARWYSRVMESNHDVTNDPKWLLQAAYAFRLAGDKDESDALLKRITQKTGGKPLMVAGRPIQPKDWLEKFTPQSDTPQKVAEWRMLFGTPDRHATAAGGEPLLLSRWSQPSTHSHPVRRHIKRLLQVLNDNRRALIPASVPLAVDGKVVYRTLRGVLVVDADTGSPIWESREGISAERILNGMPARSRVSRTRFISRRSSSSNQSYGDYHPLTGLLFHNGNYGLLSSDGRRLFLIEEQALLPRVGPGSRYSSDPEQYDKYRRSWMTNKLSAYDLKTGRPVWEAGGREHSESFDLPLAGNYFLGVPVVDGGELFVVGEKDSRIRLHVLDAKTGRPKWSRLIAYSDTKISLDSVRRWFTAQVSVQDGVLVCPTTVGWMVAVDRSNRSILWAHRYTQPKSNTYRKMRSSRMIVPAEKLNERWTPSAPVITGGHVVYTPQEDESVVCLRLRDGKRLWRIPKSDYLYLAGVFHDNAVLVGKDKVTAVKLRTGTTAWTQNLDKQAGLPSGRGIAVENAYHLPLQRGQLWTFDLRSGKVTGKLFLPRDSRPLGNLAMYRGQVLSLTPFGLTSYEQRSALFAKIQARKQDSTNDAWALLKEAEIALLRRKYPAALGLLRKIDAKQLSPADAARKRKAMIDSLSAVIRSDFQQHDAELRELERFVKSEEETFQYRRLAAERHDARGEFPEAFALYRQLAEEDGDRPLQRNDNPRLETTARHWIAGQLADLWERMPPESRKQVDARLSKDAAAIAAGSTEEQLQFVRLFGFHQSSVTVSNRLIERAAERGNFALAAHLLMRLRRHSDAQAAAAATERLARLLLAHNLPRDAKMVYRELNRRFPKVRLGNGKTAGDVVAELRTSGVLDVKADEKPASWAEWNLRVEESGTEYESHPDQQLLIGANRFPYFRNHSFQVDHGDQRLAVTRISDETLAWLVPLRGGANSSTGYYVYGSSFGHFVFVVHRNVLHCLSPVDRRVVWTKPLERRSSSNYYYSYYSSSPVRNRFRPLQDGSRIASSLALTRQSSQQAGLAFSNENYVGLYGRRRLIVMDSLTGRIIWTLRGLAEGSRVVATSDAVFVLPSGSGDPVAYRALDGLKLDDLQAPKSIASAVGVSGTHLLTADVETRSFLGLKSTTTNWKFQNPVTGKTLWKRTYKTGASFTLLEDGDLVALPRDGSLQVIDRESGAVTVYPVKESDLNRSRQVYVVADGETLFVIANSNSRTSRRVYYGYGSLTTVPVDGRIEAFDRRTQKRLWREDVDNQKLVMDYFDQSPILAFNTRRYVRRGNTGHTNLSLLAIDKRTGRQLLKSEKPSSQYYGSMTVNLADRYVEFRTYNQRLRLVAVTRTKAGAVKARRPSPK